MNNGGKKVGAGVGYVSVMLIFAVICLTIFAVLSLKAAVSNEAFNERGGEFLKQYYIADTKAKETLSRLNEIAFELKDSEFFGEAFETAAESVENISTRRYPDSVTADFSISVNSFQELAVSIRFSASGEYSIEKWQTRNISGEIPDDSPNVWDGKF